MSYQSPIEIIQAQLRNQFEEEIYKAVINVGVNVDKEELIKALRYDRNQYQKGYADRDSEIVRCKDCKHRPEIPNDYENGFDLDFPDNKCPCRCNDGWYSWYPDDDWYCPDGERKNV